MPFSFSHWHIHVPTRLTRFAKVMRAKAVPVLSSLLIVLVAVAMVLGYTAQARFLTNQTQIAAMDEQILLAQEQSSRAQDALTQLENEDPRKTNEELRKQMARLKETYSNAVNVYNDLVSLRARTTKTTTQDKLFASLLVFLSKENNASAAATLKLLTESMKTENAKLDTAIVIPANVAANNKAPGSGYQRQKVTVDGKDFLVDIIAANLNSTRVIIDTASDGTCANDCPVLPLADYVARNGAIAGVNGSYFCPESYPACSDKKNSFDTLLLNKNKVYFNSDNNVYSTVPAVIFSGNSMRLVGASQDWGRDTGVDAVIANRPMLVQGGNIAFGGNDDSKESSRGNRPFIGATGSTAYMGVVHGATVAESAKVVFALGIHDALNLDNGGSTALWSGGYKAGPGRNLPNAVLFIKK